jgi:hypothetical protein
MTRAGTERLADWERVARLDLHWRKMKTTPEGVEPLDQKMRNRVAQVALGLKDWNDLADLTGITRETLRKQVLQTPNQQKIIDKINERIRTNSPISVSQFLDRTGGEDHPVREFYSWLIANPKERHRFVELLPEPVSDRLAEPPERMTGIMEFLRRADVRPVKVVHQAGMTEGLRALASHIVHKALLDDPKLRERDVCYLPVNRDPRTQERITFPKLVASLHAFYCTSRSKAPGIETPQEIEALRQALKEIREAMLIRPAILIFDGHSALRGATPELRAVVADDALTALLREVLHPVVEHGESPGNATRFYENRFLILADHPVAGLDALSDPPLLLPPLPVERIEEVLRTQGRNHVTLLRALYAGGQFQSDSALALADTVISLRPRSPDTATPVTEGLTSPRYAYAALASHLAKTAPVALFALRMVAITEGGLRHVTLVRLVDQWRMLARGYLKDEAFQLPRLSLTQVRSTLETLKPLLFEGPDETVPGLDDAGPGPGRAIEPYPFLDEEAGDPELTQEERLRAFDIRSSELRESIIGELVGHPEGAEAIVLMHRLLAEEALRQQTQIMRHAEWRGAADVRYYRRLLQTLFHGYASLGLGPRKPAPMSALAPTVLPALPASAYKRLHAVFFRALLEHPPHFDLSRSLGRDRVKTELLLLAMNADRHPRQIWSSLYADGGAFGVRSPAYLQDGSQTSRSIAVDQLLSLARSAYQTDQLELAEVAQRDAEQMLLSDAGSGDPGEVNDNKLRARKIFLDIKIQRDPLTQSTAIEQALRDSGFDEPKLAALRVWQDRLNVLADPAEVEKALHDETDAFVREHCGTFSAGDLANWSDMLCRLGEVAVIDADRRLHPSGDTAADGRLLLQRDQARFSAFKVFYAAERIRREAFNRDPLGRSYVVNGHSTRVLVRCALQLVRALSRPGADGLPMQISGLPSRRYFIMLARRHLDLATRYAARYPSERPSLLCLEASFTRSVGGFDPAKLHAALKLLHEADMLMFTTPDRVRVRRRLLLERAKVARALAGATAASTDMSIRGNRVKWWKFAVVDVVCLWRLTTGGRRDAKITTLWERAISSQAEALRAIIADWGLHARDQGIANQDWLTLLEIPVIAPPKP